MMSLNSSRPSLIPLSMCCPNLLLRISECTQARYKLIARRVAGSLTCLHVCVCERVCKSRVKEL